jgi:negative regulator of flagellin synthesis FlgM
MSRINGLSNTNAIHKAVNSLTSRPAAAESTQGLPSSDRLELSGAAHFLTVLKQQDGVRADLVASVRKQIENGTYETPEKLDVAVNRLMDDLGV